MNTNRRKNLGKGKTRVEYQGKSGPGPGGGAGSECVQGASKADCPGESSEKSSKKLRDSIPAQSGNFNCPTSDNKGLGRAIGKGDRGTGAGPGRKRRGRESVQGKRGMVNGFQGEFHAGHIRNISRKNSERYPGSYSGRLTADTRRRRINGPLGIPRYAGKGPDQEEDRGKETSRNRADQGNLARKRPKREAMGRVTSIMSTTIKRPLSTIYKPFLNGIVRVA